MTKNQTPWISNSGLTAPTTTSGTDEYPNDITIKAVPQTPEFSEVPVGNGGSRSTGLNILSSFAGGEDTPDNQDDAFDSTGRLNLYSYQRAYVNNFGETMRNFLMKKDAKAMHAWYMPVKNDGSWLQGYDDTTRDPLTTGISWKAITWTGSHFEANDRASIHAHWEVEVPDSTGALQGRFEIVFANQTTGVVGVDKAYILTNLADFVVRCSNGQVLRLSSSSSNAKDIEFGNATDGTARRWKIRQNTDSESGGNAGSNFQILRYDDSNTLVDAPFLITRSTGQVQIGGNSGTSNGLVVNRSSGNAITINQTGAGAAGVSAVLADTSSRILQGSVSGDGTNRAAIYSDGKIEWGSGSATRDTNLYRRAANELKTDDKLITTVGLGVGNSASASSLGTVTRKMEVFDASGSSLGFVPIYDAIT